MLFNSIEFAFFLPMVFAGYWILKNALRAQNTWVLFASYVFYGWWDWRFLGLILASSLIDYFVALGLDQISEKKKRKSLLAVSVIFNLGLLGIFKYYNFFAEALVDGFTLFGKELELKTLNIILPVGISFYTFQTMSYTIDVYRNTMKPTKNLMAFMAYVSFFPQLVAGPIERASHLLPQFYKQRYFDYQAAVSGSRMILWGLFKKMVIADNCGNYANMLFENTGDYTGISLFAGAVFFAFQIYGDFSGYSDIAIGTAKLFGFDLMQNFNYPYFATSISEFWRKWHISLSSWFRDYLYVPLGGNRKGKLITLRNVMIVFLVSGFWHGANWTFIIWGAFHGLLFIPSVVNKWKANDIRAKSNFRTVIHWVVTFSLVGMGWVIFRADNLGHMYQYFNRMINGMFSLQGLIQLYDILIFEGGWFFALLTGIFFFFEFKGKKCSSPLELIGNWRSRTLRWGVYYIIIILLVYCGGVKQDFIYFQF